MALLVCFSSTADVYRTPATYLDRRYDAQLIAHIAVLVMLITAAIVSISQHFIYEVNRLKWVKIDERQLDVRRRVFEISHKVIALFIFLLAWDITNGYHLLQTWMQPGYFNAYLYPLWAIVIFIFSFPSMVAAHIQES